MAAITLYRLYKTKRSENKQIESEDIHKSEKISKQKNTKPFVKKTLGDPEPKVWKSLTGVKNVGNKPEVQQKYPPIKNPTVVRGLASQEKSSKEKEATKEVTPKSSGGWLSKVSPVSQPKEVTERKTDKSASGKNENIKKSPVPIVIPKIIRIERDEVKEAEDFEKELRLVEKQAEEQAKSLMKPVRLNIDTNAKSKGEKKISTDRELSLFRRMCGEMREVSKSENKEEREEKKKEMDKVRSARSVLQICLDFKYGEMFQILFQVSGQIPF